MSKLPPAWEQVPLASITKEASQRIPSADEQITYIDIGSVDRGSKTIVAPQRLLGADAPSRARKQVRSGDTLVSMTRPNLNAVALVPSALDGQIASTGFDVLRPLAGIDPRWIAYLVRTEAFVEAMSSVVQGALYPAVRSKDVRAYRVPLAPSAEQTRIADQIDKLLARVQACNDRTDTIPALLKRFRQAVLNAALAGDLTAEWRDSNEAEDWSSTTIFSICEPNRVITYGVIKLGDEVVGGTPCLRTSNVRWLRFELEGMKRISPDLSAQYGRTILLGGEVLVNVRGTLGGVAVASSEMKGWNVSREVAVLPVDRALVNPSYVAFWVASENSQRWLAKMEKGVAYVGINIEDLRKLPIRLPSLAEQSAIVAQVQSLLSLADRIEAGCTAARTQARRLTPLVLAKAFRGELVQKDPQDEPASVLLQRIAAAQPAKVQASRGQPRSQPKRRSATPELDPTDWTSLPNGAWVAPADPDGQAAAVWLTAVLRAWGESMPEREARLASLLCQQPRLFTVVLPAAQAAQWSRLIGDEARPLPAQVLRFQPAINSHWGRAIKGMRARGDLVETGRDNDIIWTLGPDAAGIETAGWPDGRAGFVVAYLRAHGIASVLPLLAPSAQEFVDVRAA
ncbi:MAG: restriction endonuclease subunit S [Rhodocyclaceae bacterium]